MSYMRGDRYLWCDGTHLHFWAADGSDGWAKSGWVEDRGEEASGVALPLEVVDELVVMRLAELVEAGAFAAAVERALSRHGGNGGCVALEQYALALKEALERNA
jgi:hypothetical protein